MRTVLFVLALLPSLATAQPVKDEEFMLFRFGVSLGRQPEAFTASGKEGNTAQLQAGLGVSIADVVGVGLDARAYYSSIDKGERRFSVLHGGLAIETLTRVVVGAGIGAAQLQSRLGWADPSSEWGVGLFGVLGVALTSDKEGRALTLETTYYRVVAKGADFDALMLGFALKTF